MGTLKQQLLQCKHLPVATMANFQLIPKNEAGDFTVPDGWSFVGLHEMGNPEIQGAMGSLFTGPEVVDEFNKGNAFDVPEGWELVDINESNFGEYMPKIGHLIDPTMAQGMENGTIKFIRKL